MSAKAITYVRTWYYLMFDCDIILINCRCHIIQYLSIYKFKYMCCMQGMHSTELSFYYMYLLYLLMYVCVCTHECVHRYIHMQLSEDILTPHIQLKDTKFCVLMLQSNIHWIQLQCPCPLTSVGTDTLSLCSELFRGKYTKALFITLYSCLLVLSMCSRYSQTESFPLARDYCYKETKLQLKTNN